DEKHRRFIDFALADHDRTVDRQFVEFAAHGIDRSLVGCLVLAVTAQARRGYRRPFGDAYDLETENTLQQKLRLDSNARHFTLSSETRASLSGALSFFRSELTVVALRSPYRAPPPQGPSAPRPRWLHK